MADKKTIKIGFKNYVIEKPYEISETKGDYYGTVDYDASIIKIADRFDTHQKNSTFIHELLHCICSRFGLDELNKDEHSIDLLANGIYETILDNPHIFLMEDI